MWRLQKQINPCFKGSRRVCRFSHGAGPGLALARGCEMCRGRCVLTFFSAREPSLCAVFTRFQDWDVSMPSRHFAQPVTFGGTAPPRGSSWLRAGKSDRSGGVAGGSRRRQTSTTLRLLVISRLKCLLTFFNFCCVPVRDTMQTERRSPLPGSWVRSFGEGFRAHTCPHTREESCRFTKCCSRSLVCRVRCHPTRLLSSNFFYGGKAHIT